jgi:hypothetical protein
MKKLTAILFLGLLLSLALVYTVYADEVGDPVGGCPDRFTLHHAAHHDEHHMDGDGHHLHVGSDTDLNADGWICVKHVSSKGNVHLHVDNVVLLP